VSSFLYGLGRAAYRRRRAVLLAWLGGLVLLIGLAAAISDRFDEKFTLPGTESQTALDALNRNFPQAGGVTAQVIVVAPPGSTVREAEVRREITDAAAAFETIEGVLDVTSPYDEFAKGLISPDSSAAITTVRVERVDGQIRGSTLDALEEETRQLQAALPGSVASAGGEAFGDQTPSFSIVEALGVLVALIVLLITLGSLRAAGMPLLTALLGVALSVVLIVAATGLTVISSTTPMLAVMLGLAVGIDYALFITSRHRDQLRDGMDPEESAARALATAGSAVVFAGLTVMIALVGLSVAGIPFLTTMGIAAAVAVAIAVLIALTLLPALLGFGGEKLRPQSLRDTRRGERKRSRSVGSVEPSPPSSGRFDGRPESEARRALQIGAPRRWVRIITKWPVLTIAVVIIGLGAMAYPAKDLQIALPDNGQAEPNTPARITYDLISEHFGVGYNGPLVVSAVIVGSDDPLEVMDGIADDVRALPGVASVPLATPNEDASFGVVQVIPSTGPDAQETKDLVLRIRGMKDQFQADYDVPVSVTGYTAVAIDISNRLGAALLPFGIVVVGLSLLLLAMVFRSVAVPIKATVGYLLSVAAAFGATAMVFEYGWFAQIFNVHQTGPVISFLPILLMGILFGLAMDYEVFLVSRMREDFVHGGEARAAIENGFAASARVVVAAAVIMFAVFAAFVPEGEGAIKTIAFALAAGVFVDAFVVRMTLVPAVMALLGRSAWWLPKWIDRRLPSFDVEGEGLAHQVGLAGWPAPDDDHLIYAEELRLAGRQQSLRVAVRPREILVLEGPPDSGKTALLLTLAGRMRLLQGRVKVAGLVLPEQAREVRRLTGIVDAKALIASGRDVRAEFAGVQRAGARIVFVDHADLLTGIDDRAALASLLDEVVHSQAESRAVVLATRDHESVVDLIPTTYSYVDLTSQPAPALDRTP
jgi:putative drug exporter of the RND superfamily